MKTIVSIMSENEPINTGLGMRICLAGISKRFSAVSQLSTTDFYNLWYQRDNENSKDKMLLIDIREPCEQDISFISGCSFFNSNIDVDENVQKVKEIIKAHACAISQHGSPETLTVVAYCSIGYRSSLLIKHLLQSDLNTGQSEVLNLKFYNLEGSIFKWANEGRPLVHGENQLTQFVHPYNMMWGKLLNENLKKWD